jgi:ubiquinone/menaquinone biosynthesis C-methylase UbiE
MTTQQTHPSLESLVEGEDLGFEILHPGGLDVTQELADLCNIKKDTSVLDVASGTGESACYLAEKIGARVSGIDGSELMIERAREKAKQRNLSIEFRKGDAHQLPFEDDVFDVAISECTVCLLDKEKAIREMVRVVKPNGYVGFHDICWKSDTPEHMKKRLAEIEDEKPETLKGWKALCEQAGLTDVRAIDRSSLIPIWMKETTSHLSLASIAKIVIKVLRMWGFSGLLDVWESERIFQSKYTGYGMIVGRKPGTPSLTYSH